MEPRTLAFWVARPTYQQRQSVKRASKLDPSKGAVVAMLKRHPYPSQQELQEIRTKGYTGGSTSL